MKYYIGTNNQVNSPEGYLLNLTTDQMTATAVHVTAALNAYFVETDLSYEEKERAKDEAWKKINAGETLIIGEVVIKGSKNNKAIPWISYASQPAKIW